MSRLLVLLFLASLLGLVIARSLRRVLRSGWARQLSAVWSAVEDARRQQRDPMAGGPTSKKAEVLRPCAGCGIYVPAHRATSEGSVTLCHECKSR